LAAPGRGASVLGAAGTAASVLGAAGRIGALSLILTNLMLPDERIGFLLERDNIVFSSFFAIATEALELYDQSVLSSLLAEAGVTDRALTVSLYLSNRLIIFFFLGEEAEQVPRSLVIDTVKCLGGQGMRIRRVSVSRLHCSASELPAAYCEVLDLPGALSPDRDEVVYSFAENHFGRIRGASVADICLLVDASCERLRERREDADAVIGEFCASLSRLCNRDPLIMKFYLIDFCVRFIKGRVAPGSVDMSGLVDETAGQLKQLADMTLARRILAGFAKQVSESLCPPGPKSSLLANNILLYIDLHASEHLSLDSLASHFEVSPTYVSALVKKHTGKKYTDCVIDAKMALAKNLLLDPRYRINEVSEAVGYKNYVTFYNVFTKREGITPRDFRSGSREGR
jgi:AraC-like DNA-binding protein